MESNAKVRQPCAGLKIAVKEAYTFVCNCIELRLRLSRCRAQTICLARLVPISLRHLVVVLS